VDFEWVLQATKGAFVRIYFDKCGEYAGNVLDIAVFCYGALICWKWGCKATK
jgi:hypothetical protein